MRKKPDLATNILKGLVIIMTIWQLGVLLVAINHKQVSIGDLLIFVEFICVISACEFIIFLVLLNHAYDEILSVKNDLDTLKVQTTLFCNLYRGNSDEFHR